MRLAAYLVVSLVASNSLASDLYAPIGEVTQQIAAVTQTVCVPVPNSAQLGLSLYAYPSTGMYWQDTYNRRQNQDLSSIADSIRVIAQILAEQHTVPVGQLLQASCGKCHVNDDKGGYQMNLRNMNAAEALRIRELVRSGAMPPPSEPPIAADVRQAIIDEALDLASP